MKLNLLVIFLLFPILIFATDTKYLYMKSKASSDNKVVKVKFGIKSPMLGYEYYGKRRNLEENFISHITAKVENRIVLDMSTGPYLREDPVIKYKFKDVSHSNKIDYIITDNKGYQKEYSFDIKRNNLTQIQLTKKMIPSQKDSITDYRKLKPKAWASLTIEEAVTELYGLVKNPIEDKVSLSGPEKNFCDRDIPIHISSDVDLESLAIFTDKIEQPTVAVFSISSISIIDISLSIKMYKSCTDYSVLVIGKDRDGKFYKTSTKGRIACADGCGGGG